MSDDRRRAFGISMRNYSIIIRHRCSAAAWCAGAVLLAVGAKAATLVFCVLTIATLISVSWCRERLSRFTQEMMRPSAAVLAASAFGGFAALSALWARDPSSAFLGGLALLMIVLSGQVLKSALQMLSPPAAVLSAGWLMIGFVAGGLVLLEEMSTGYGIFRWVLDHIPIRGPQGSMLAELNGNWVLLTISIANWSVAGINVLMWPLLLITCALMGEKRKLAVIAGLFALFAIITVTSDHQTSQVALAISTVVFILANRFRDFTRRVMLLLCVAAILTVVPISYFVGRNAELQTVSWVQPSLKERFKIWGNVSARVHEGPLVGIGANNTTNDYTHRDLPPGQPVVRHHPHDMLLQIWLELGGVGAGLMIVALLLLFRELRALDREAQAFALATLAVVFVESIATWNLWSRWFQAIVVIAMVLIWLGVRVRDVLRNGQSPTFAEIWLPKRLIRSFDLG